MPRTTNGIASGGKLEWLLWLTAMLLCAVATGYLFVFSGDAGRAGTVVTGMIVVLFLATLVKSYLDISFLDRETKLATRQVQQLQELNDVGSFLGSAQK